MRQIDRLSLTKQNSQWVSRCLPALSTKHMAVRYNGLHLRQVTTEKTSLSLGIVCSSNIWVTIRNNGAAQTNTRDVPMMDSCTIDIWGQIILGYGTHSSIVECLAACLVPSQQTPGKSCLQALWCNNKKKKMVLDITKCFWKKRAWIAFSWGPWNKAHRCSELKNTKSNFKV